MVVGARVADDGANVTVGRGVSSSGTAVVTTGVPMPPIGLGVSGAASVRDVGTGLDVSCCLLL